MALSPGTRLGPYEILAPLGAGGMGEVYRAKDTRLERTVAVKVLPESVAGDSERLARFEREAKVLASLNHPNVAAIYGVEESGGTPALVMELVEGPTLQDRIAQGPIPIDEALPIAREIAEGLEYAHERGIIHRDLKPANIKLTGEGKVKILDFGLAKALDPIAGASSPDVTHSPTITAAATQAGVILGTAAYMSPEQARGRAVDRRADVWAFGAVLYEVLAGRRAFEGETVSDTLAAVLRAEPEWSTLPSGTPAKVRELLRHCLVKDPKRRLHDIADARIEIEETLAGSPSLGGESAATARFPNGSLRHWLPWALAGLLGLGLAVSALRRVRGSPSHEPVLQLSLALPPGRPANVGGGPTTFAAEVSSDGRRVVYVGSEAGTTRLYVRSLESSEPQPLAGTEGVQSVFLSPDGEWAGFFVAGRIKKIRLSGGAPIELVHTTGDPETAQGRGGSWARDGTILYSPTPSSGLWEISAGGGKPRVLAVPDRSKGEISYRWPQILPDGRSALFVTKTASILSFDEARIEWISLDSQEKRVLLEGGTNPRYAAGNLLYERGGILYAARFNASEGRITGPAIPVVKGVVVNSSIGLAQYSVSQSGTLLYVRGDLLEGRLPLLWVDRRGESVPVATEQRAYVEPRLSPDGRRIVARVGAANDKIWTFDLGRGVLSRLTFGPGNDHSPVWSPDGVSIIFASDAAGPSELYRIRADGSGTAERLTRSEASQTPTSWSSDGRSLLFEQVGSSGRTDLWVLDLSDSASPRAITFLRTPFSEREAAFSPDGRWVVYSSNESGSFEVYLRAYPSGGGRMQVSSSGGRSPVWSRTGRELFYVEGKKMMAVTVEAGSVGRPHPLFERPFVPSMSAESSFDVTPDGRRFLMVGPLKETRTTSQYEIVLNWSTELERLAPAGRP